LYHEALAEVNARISAAAKSAGRDPADVRLLLATKTQPAERIAAALAAMRSPDSAATRPVLLGENRVQELVAKAASYAEWVATGSAEVHLIGHLQRNKIARAIEVASCIESVDSLALAQALDSRVSPDAPLDVMIQVNVSQEASKSGVAPGEVSELAQVIGGLANLRLTGLMTIGRPLELDSDGVATPESVARTRAGYAQLRELRDGVLASGDPGTEQARELSMGMSHDLEHAIAEGATIVRVGTAIFGERAIAP